MQDEVNVGRKDKKIERESITKFNNFKKQSLNFISDTITRFGPGKMPEINEFQALLDSLKQKRNYLNGLKKEITINRKKSLGQSQKMMHYAEQAKLIRADLESRLQKWSLNKKVPKFQEK